MSKTAVIVDSSSYIDKNTIKKYNIFVVYDPIIFATEPITEDHWKTQQSFFTDLNNAKEVPTTSQPTPGSFQKVFEEVTSQGYDSAIIVTLSSGISGTYQSAKNIAEAYEGFKEVLVWDSKIAILGAGNQAIYAAELLKQGKTISEIKKSLKTLRDSTSVFFVVDSIKHLQRTGRISSGQALVAGAIKIKPILTFDDGEIKAAARARKMDGAWEFIEKNFSEIVKNAKNKLRVTISDANNPELADLWLAKGKELWPQVTFERGIIGPFIAVHTGEKSVGFIWADDYQNLLGENND